MSYASEVKAALAIVRRTGKFYGVKADTKDLKEAARLVYNESGLDDMSKFLTGWKQRLHPQSVMADARYGYDEVSWPKGATKLPKGTLAKDPYLVAKRAMAKRVPKRSARGAM